MNAQTGNQHIAKQTGLPFCRHSRCVRSVIRFLLFQAHCSGGAARGSGLTFLDLEYGWSSYSVPHRKYVMGTYEMLCGPRNIHLQKGGGADCTDTGR